MSLIPNRGKMKMGLGRTVVLAVPPIPLNDKMKMVFFGKTLHSNRPIHPRSFIH